MRTIDHRTATTPSFVFLGNCQRPWRPRHDMRHRSIERWEGERSGRMVEGQRTHSNLMKPILLTAAGNPENQDRGLVIQDGSRAVLCVADGAGGLSGGAEAETFVLELVRQNVSLIIHSDSCAGELRKMEASIDKASIAGGSSTALAIV